MLKDKYTVWHEGVVYSPQEPCGIILVVER